MGVAVDGDEVLISTAAEEVVAPTVDIAAEEKVDVITEE